MTLGERLRCGIARLRLQQEKHSRKETLKKGERLPGSKKTSHVDGYLERRLGVIPVKKAWRERRKEEENTRPKTLDNSLSTTGGKKIYWSGTSGLKHTFTWQGPAGEVAKNGTPKKDGHRKKFQKIFKKPESLKPWLRGSTPRGKDITEKKTENYEDGKERTIKGTRGKERLDRP